MFLFRIHCRPESTSYETSVARAKRLIALLAAMLPLMFSPDVAMGDTQCPVPLVLPVCAANDAACISKNNIWKAICACNSDPVNLAMNGIDPKPGVNPKSGLKWVSHSEKVPQPGWLTLDPKSALKEWYSKQAESGALGAIPNIDDYFEKVMGQTRIQNLAGTKPGYWMASMDNQALIAPQTLYTIKTLGSDVVVMRVNPLKTIDYLLYENAQTTEATKRTLSISYTDVYQKVRNGTVNNDKRHVVLGYGFGTKAVGDSVQVCRGSGMIESRFANFHDALDASADDMSSLGPGEYISALSGSGKPLRDPKEPCERLGAGTYYPDDLIRINYANLDGAYKSTRKALSAYTGTVSETNQSRILSGLAFDGTTYTPEYDMFLSKSAPALIQNTDKWQCQYQAGLRSKFLENSKKFFVFFNVLEPGSIKRLNENRCDANLPPVSSTTWRQRQENLLQYAHGGLNEYFGGAAEGINDTKCQKEPIYDDDDCDFKEPVKKRTNFCKRKFTVLLEEIRMWRRNPEKAFLLAARSPKLYHSYDDEYKWFEYLYGVYLLGAGSNTAFKPLSTFQLPNSEGRTDALQVFDFQLADLGAPLGDGTNEFKINVDKDSGIYWRKFEKGLVLVYPYKATMGNGSTNGFKNAEFAFPGVHWDWLPPTLLEGQAAILTPTRRSSYVGRTIDFKQDKVRAFFADDTGVMSCGDSGLRIKETAPEPGDSSQLSDAYLTDILLNVVKYPSHRSQINIDFVLNNDRSSWRPAQARKIMLVAEVDDQREITSLKDDPRRNTVVFELYMGPVPDGLTNPKEKPLFRRAADPSSALEEEKVPYIRLSAGDLLGSDTATAEVPTGQLTRYVLNPTSIFEKPEFKHLKFKRWDMMRFFGDYSLKSVVIGNVTTMDQYSQGPMGFGDQNPAKNCDGTPYARAR